MSMIKLISRSLWKQYIGMRKVNNVRSVVVINSWNVRRGAILLPHLAFSNRSLCSSVEVDTTNVTVRNDKNNPVTIEGGISMDPKEVEMMAQVLFDGHLYDILHPAEPKIIKVKIYQDELGGDLIEASYSSRVRFAGGLFSKQFHMTAANVSLFRCNRVNKYRHESSIRLIINGGIVAWYGEPGSGKSQQINKVLEDLFKLMVTGRKLKCIFFRVDKHLFHVVLDSGPDGEVTNQPTVKVQYTAAGETFEQHVRYILGYKHQHNLKKDESVFVCDLFDDENGVNDHVHKLSLQLGVLFVLSNTDRNFTFSTLEKGRMIEKHFVAMTSPEEVLVCGRAMLDLQPDACHFAPPQSTVPDHTERTKHMLDTLRSRIQEVGPIMRYVIVSEEEFKRSVITLRSNTTIILDSITTLENVPKVLSRFFAAVFKAGVVRSEMHLDYSEAVSREFLELHKDKLWLSDDPRSWEWRPLSPKTAVMLARDSRDSDRISVLKQLEIDHLVQGEVSKAALNLKQTDPSVVRDFKVSEWDICADLGPGISLSSSMKYAAHDTQQLMELLRHCTAEQTRSTEHFDDSVLKTPDGTLIIGKYGRGVFQRVYKIGKLIVACQESRSPPADHAVLASNLLSALERMGLKDHHRLLFVYVTDYSSSPMLDGLPFRFPKSMGVPARMGVCQWSKLLKAEKHRGGWEESGSVDCLKKELTARCLSTEGDKEDLVSRLQEDEERKRLGQNSKLLATEQGVSKVLTVIVRAGFYPSLTKVPLLPMSAADHTISRLKDALQAMHMPFPSNAVKKDLVRLLREEVSREKDRVLDEIFKAAGTKRLSAAEWKLLGKRRSRVKN